MDENELSYKIIGVALELHRSLGPGLLESVYETALAHDLVESGLDVKRQIALPFVYKDIKMEAGFRMDILVNDKVVLEIKSIDALAPVHFAQTLTYLKLSNFKTGTADKFQCQIIERRNPSYCKPTLTLRPLRINLAGFA